MKVNGFVRLDTGCGDRPDAKLALLCLEDEKVEYIGNEINIEIPGAKGEER